MGLALSIVVLKKEASDGKMAAVTMVAYWWVVPGDVGRMFRHRFVGGTVVGAQFDLGSFAISQFD